jgi:alanyl-tRNA synthetase
LGKKELATLFASDPERYYKVDLFDNEGFKRQKCSKCDKFFWSLTKRESCPDHECYSFIGNPPTSRRLDYINTWKEIESYFESNNHSIIRRYPVVCRWRDDLYFTIASIVDFQRIMDNKVVFELPSNPLVVPQMCLRFNDIENVGLSGRHYTGFCMIGQTCNTDVDGGYWKDKCIELDYEMLTDKLGIHSHEIVFVEDVWIGAGAFGYSLEYYVNGLELGNAVFTEFEGNENNYHVMDNKIIDMGAGLERLSWITMGTPTSYDCSFGPVVQKLIDRAAISENSEMLSKYFTAISSKLGEEINDIGTLKPLIAKTLGISYDDLSKIISPYEAVYTIADHTRTLLFAIADGALPSNVGGGYNLRVILRRAISILEKMGWNIRLEDVTDLHIGYLKQMYPELEEHTDDVRTILQIESDRYVGTNERMYAIATSIKNGNKELSVNDLIRMYESDGITPDFLENVGAIDKIPSTFYTRLADLHAAEQTIAQTQKQTYSLAGIASTRPLYYEDVSMREFSATIIKIIDDRYVILDQSAFYPRGGGQEPDTGVLGGIRVIEVTKQDGVIVHKLQNKSDFVEGQTIDGRVNNRRRELITKHHTATHILNSSARNTLGSWVWQNSAFKEEDYGRLDITHHSALNREEIWKIEQTANDVIRQNLPVIINTYDRGAAEQNYTFRIYQGGVVPSNSVRIVNINNWDIEACGGTHVRKTGEIGTIKITKSERIQDGIVRLEFVAGEAAINYLQRQESQLTSISQALGSSKEKVVESLQKMIHDTEVTKKKMKIILRKISPYVATSVSKTARHFTNENIKVYSTYDEELDDEYHIAIGEKSIELDPSLIYVALISKEQGLRVIVFAGEYARKKIRAGIIANRVSIELGGSGRGNDRFGQGGGRFKDKITDSLKLVEELVTKEFSDTNEGGVRDG